MSSSFAPIASSLLLSQLDASKSHKRRWKTHIAASSEPFVNRDMLSRRDGGGFEDGTLFVSPLALFVGYFELPAPSLYVSHLQIFTSTRPQPQRPHSFCPPKKNIERNASGKQEGERGRASWGLLLWLSLFLVVETLTLCPSSSQPPAHELKCLLRLLPSLSPPSPCPPHLLLPWIRPTSAEAFSLTLSMESGTPLSFSSLLSQRTRDSLATSVSQYF